MNTLTTANNSLTSYLSDDHNACDQHFAAAENAVAARAWPQAQAEFARFLASIRHHFALEEDILFPAFEQHTGMHGGPTAVMRAEHQQMNSLLDDLAAAAEQRNQNGYLGLSETLLMLMRQHNLKEENILYPMADQALNGERPALLERMRGLAA